MTDVFDIVRSAMEACYHNTRPKSRNTSGKVELVAEAMESVAVTLRTLASDLHKLDSGDD